MRAIKDAGVNRWTGLILLDVKNAFNMASWRIITSKLERRGVQKSILKVIQSYFNDRELKLPGGVELALSAGVPQGSVMGPTLWNVLYDDVLKIEVPEETNLIAYADDLAVIVADSTREGMQQKANETIRTIERWMRGTELKLAPEKTEVLVFAGCRRLREIRFKVGGVEVRPSTSVKYLGV